MKRYIAANEKELRYIDIIIVMDNLYYSDIAANLKVKHPDNISEDQKWPDEQLAFYNDFLDTVEIEIKKYFKIDRQGQSNSYSYYFEFDTNINTWKLRIRISDHYVPGTKAKPDYSKNDNVRRLFRQIIIGSDKEFTSYPKAADAISEICKGISEGDLDIISKSWRNPQF